MHREVERSCRDFAASGQMDTSCVFLGGELAQPHERGSVRDLYIAADWTFRVDIYKYSFSETCDLIFWFRKFEEFLGGLFPLLYLMLLRLLQARHGAHRGHCTAQAGEHVEMHAVAPGDWWRCLRLRRCLAEALTRYGLPDPHQVNTDYFSSAGGAAPALWPKAGRITEIWLIRNLRNNHTTCMDEAEKHKLPKAVCAILGKA